MPTSRFLIYALFDPRTPDMLRYVGRSASGLKRPRQHGGSAHMRRHPSHNTNWIAGLQASGVVFGIRVLEEVASMDLLNACEKKWIVHGIAEGWPLTNVAPGGDGAQTPATAEHREHMRIKSTGRRHTEEAKQKVSAAKKGIPRPESVREKLRQHRISDEQKAAIGRANSRPWSAERRAAYRPPVVSAETRAKMSAARKGRKADPVAIAKTAAANRGRKQPWAAEIWKRPDVQAKVEAARERQRGTHNPRNAEKNRSPEMRAKVSAALKGRVFSPETIQRMKDGQQRRRDAARLAKASATAPAPVVAPDPVSGP